MTKKALVFLLIIIFLLVLILFSYYIILKNSRQEKNYSGKFIGPPKGAVPYVKGPTSPPPVFNFK